MQELISKIAPSVKNFLGVTSTSVIILVATAWQYSDEFVEMVVSQVTDRLTENFLEAARNDKELKLVINDAFYHDLSLSLEKQKGKLEKDPGDLKPTDIISLTSHCVGFYGTEYLPTAPTEERLKAESLCDKMTEIYTSQYN